MAGPFDFLHIKRRTAGSSNELSFDVLDAASKEAADKGDRQQRQSRASTAPKPSQGTYHGVAGSSTLSGLAEVERRKRARRARTARLWIIAAVAVIALVGTGVFFGYRIYQDRVDFSSRFNQLIDRFIEIDQTMVDIDSLMADPLNSVELVERAEVANRFASLNRELNAVIAEAHDMESSAFSESDRSALEQAAEAADARSSMIAAAESAFTLSERANQISDEAVAAWNKVLEADSQAREATELANSARTEQATRNAQEKTKQARDLMDVALADLERVEKEEPRVDLSTERKYVSKRIEALDAANDTANALLADDRAAATAANDAYNAADSEAVALAADLPETLAGQVKATYESDLDRILESYTDARNAVTAADSALRSYL